MRECVKDANSATVSLLPILVWSESFQQQGKEQKVAYCLEAVMDPA